MSLFPSHRPDILSSWQCCTLCTTTTNPPMSLEGLLELNTNFALGQLWKSIAGARYQLQPSCATATTAEG